MNAHQDINNPHAKLCISELELENAELRNRLNEAERLIGRCKIQGFGWKADLDEYPGTLPSEVDNLLLKQDADRFRFLLQFHGYSNLPVGESVVC
jgi:hypothetical protein